jgi:predicted ABC-type ATPase
MELYIIAGPNGVGKTTFARKFLPKYANCKNFVNADLIAQGMSPFSPEAAAIRAGRLVISEIGFFSHRQVSFGFETTLSGRSYMSLIRRRFDRSARNFFREYQPLVDSWYLFDNTDTKPLAIAFKKGTKLRIMNHEMYKSLVARYGEK